MDQEMQMSKPYDKDALFAELKKHGIEEGEQVAKIVTVTLAKWLRTSMKMSTEGLVGKLDDFAIPGVNYFEKLALEKIELIDGAAAPVSETSGL